MNTATMAAALTPERGRIYAEAKRIARRDGITNPETFATLFQSLCYEEWRRAVEPWFKLKSDVMATRIPRVSLIIGDGSVQFEYEPLSPELQQAFDRLDEAIRNEALRYGLVLPAYQS